MIAQRQQRFNLAMFPIEACSSFPISLPCGTGKIDSVNSERVPVHYLFRCGLDTPRGRILPSFSDLLSFPGTSFPDRNSFFPFVSFSIFIYSAVVFSACLFQSWRIGIPYTTGIPERSRYPLFQLLRTEFELADHGPRTKT
jgi:hypothetical protein